MVQSKRGLSTSVLPGALMESKPRAGGTGRMPPVLDGVLICCCPVFSGRAGGPPTLQLHPEDQPVHTERGERLQRQGQALDEEDREL